MFNVGFLSSGVTRACLNAVGKMPVRRDVLIMCDNVCLTVFKSSLYFLWLLIHYEFMV